MHHVTIRNFQSHKETQIELSPTVNSLEGVSDSGKSAVLRAMLWALTNKPDGTAFASYWAKNKKGEIQAPVSVSIDNITRIRSKEFNGYIRYGASGEERYEALKGAVPVEIERAVNIGAVNIQRQMDPPFLLSATPGEAARYLNSLVGLEEIDTYQKALKGKSRDNANSLKDENARLAEAEKNFAKYDWVDGAKEKVAELEKICGVVEAFESDIATLGALEELAQFDEKIQRTKCVLINADAKINSYPNTDVLYADLMSLQHLDEIKDAGAKLERSKLAVQAAEPKIDALSHIDVRTLDFEVNTLVPALFTLENITIGLAKKNGCISAANALIERGQYVGDCIRDLEETIRYVNEVEALSNSIHTAEHELAEVSASLEGKACPICGKPL
jgi:DNA repair exonuclease SbcCD ATPase subunit